MWIFITIIGRFGICPSFSLAQGMMQGKGKKAGNRGIMPMMSSEMMKSGTMTEKEE